MEGLFYFRKAINQEWELTPAMPTLRRKMQEVRKFMAIVPFRVSSRPTWDTCHLDSKYILGTILCSLFFYP